MTGTIEYLIVCPVCELDFAGHADEAEAVHLAGVHDDLHHGSRPEAFVVPVTVASEAARGP